MDHPHVLVIAPERFGFRITCMFMGERYRLSLIPTVPESLPQIRHARPDIIILDEDYLRLAASPFDQEWSVLDLYHALEQRGCADIPLISISENYRERAGSVQLGSYPTIIAFSGMHVLQVVAYLYQRVPSPMVRLWYSLQHVFRHPARRVPLLLLVTHPDHLPFYHDVLQTESWHSIIRHSLEDAKDAIVLHRPDAIVLDDEGLAGPSLDLYWYVQQYLHERMVFVLLSSAYSPYDESARHLELLRCEPSQRDAAVHALPHLLTAMHPPPPTSPRPWILVLAAHRTAISVAGDLIRQGYQTTVCTSVVAAITALAQQPFDALVLDTTELTESGAEQELSQAILSIHQTTIPILCVSERAMLDDQRLSPVWIPLHSYFSYLPHLNALEYLYATLPTPYVQHWYRQRTHWEHDQETLPQILLLGDPQVTQAYAAALTHSPLHIVTMSSFDDAKFFILHQLPRIVVVADSGETAAVNLASRVYLYLRYELQTGISFILISARYTAQDVRALDLVLFASDARDAVLHTLHTLGSRSPEHGLDTE